ncbi:MAG: acyltransferase [Candidatus Aenigmatarchaeota archaeon]
MVNFEINKHSSIKNVNFGKNVLVQDHVNLFECEIGDETKIGSFTYIEGGVKIGKRCKIEAHVFIPTGVTIEDEVFVGPGVVFTNDKYPRSTNPDSTIKTAKDWKVLPTIVKRGASIGAHSVIGPGITIGEFSIVGMGSVVTKDVPPYKVVYGNPAKVIGDVFDKEERLK